MNIDFKLKQSVLDRANKIYLNVMFEGGDADTEHPEEYEIKGVSFQDYREKMEIIENSIQPFKILKKILDDDSIKYEQVLSEYGEAIANLFENVPNDPQSDYQFKCYLGSMTLIGYDDKGNMYKSYI